MDPAPTSDDPLTLLKPHSDGPNSAASSSSTSRTQAPRARSRSIGFTLEIPRASSSAGSQRRPSPSSSAVQEKGGMSSSRGPSSSREDSTRARRSPDANTSRKSNEEEGVWRILWMQRNEGMEDTFLCQLEEGGKKVRRSRTELLTLAPRLLAAFEASQALSSPSGSGSHTNDDDGDSDSEIIVVQELRGGQNKKKRADQEEDEDMLDESASDDQQEGDSSASEPSQPSSSSDDGDDEDDTDSDLGPRRSSRSRKVVKSKSKAKPEPTRQSTRASRNTQAYDFGDGSLRVEAESSDDDEGGGSGVATRTRTRASLSSTGEDRDDDDGGEEGESSDELSMRPTGRKAKAEKKTVGRKVGTIMVDSEEDELASGSGEGEAEHENGLERFQDLHRAVCPLSFANTASILRLNLRGSLSSQMCSKCREPPAAELLETLHKRRNRKKPGRRKKRDEFADDTDAEEERYGKLGAWVECGVCVASYHFGCLPAPQRKELVDMLKAEHASLHAPPAADGDGDGMAIDTSTSLPVPPPAPAVIPPREKDELDPEKTFSIGKCPACAKRGGRKCFVCGVNGRKVSERERDEYAANQLEDGAELEGVGGAKKLEDGDGDGQVESTEIVPGLMFRCKTCKRVAHYGCLEMDDPEWSLADHIKSYFNWEMCHDCYRYDHEWQVKLDVILAWKEDEPQSPSEGGKDDDEEEEEGTPDLAVAVKRKDEKTGREYVVPSAKDLMSRAQYLVKWQNQSYRHLDWVPHAWLAAAHGGKLANFLARGSTVSFEPPQDDASDDEDPTASTNAKDDLGSAPAPDPDAIDRIPKGWRTVERVLDAWYTSPKTGNEVHFSDFKTRPEDADESVKLVSKCYMKWGDLPYAQCTEEEPPAEDDEGYAEFVAAYKAFLVASDKTMLVPTLSSKLMEELDKPRAVQRFSPLKEQPDCITGGKLMDFQLEGVNFLFFHWWKREGCILADEMGLGKTCQIISFLSYLQQVQGARPFLVTVPNSLISNWMREFAKWAPNMRVVPYSGDADSRRIVEKYELFAPTGTLKAHVVLATYEALEKNVSVFKKVKRWDCLVVDEGQRLKSGKSGQLWRAILELNISQKILLTGTPLNNNLTELFNLLSFIDPRNFADVDALARRFEELTPELVEEVRELLKPYFLRRTKNLVLNLPPLTEVVVPVSMTVLQRQIYRGVLQRNASAIHSIVQSTGSAKGGKVKKSSFANILMELRKTLNHPFLVSPELEPPSNSSQEAWRHLTDASAKFLLLSRMLPKLKAAGHKVLIFSQFKIALNIIEQFLAGLDMKYLRLDGDTPQIERQRDVDRFNAPDSEYFAYLLSTRAGGVGLTLTAADVVILYDQDFNPFQDMQAIARAHRIGQKNPVRVFRMLVKGTAEERIYQAGTKKRGLEHLIIQRIDAKDENEDVESILQFGAKAIFDDSAAEASSIKYTDADIDELLAKTAEPTTAAENEAAGAFSHAMEWVREKGGLDEVAATEGDGAGANEDLHDFWAGVVEQQQKAERAAKAAKEANVGRGKRRRAAVNYKLNLSPAKKGNAPPGSPLMDGDDAHDHLSSGDDWLQTRDDIDSDDDDFDPMDAMDVDDRPSIPEELRAPPPLARLDGPPPPNGQPQAGPSSLAAPRKKKSKHASEGSATPSAEDQQALAALRLKKAEKRKRTLESLTAAAYQIGDGQVLVWLAEAKRSKSTDHQRELCVKATIRINELKAQLDHVPLAPAPASVNHPPIASTSSTPSTALGTPVVPQLKPKRWSQTLPAGQPSSKRAKITPPGTQDPHPSAFRARGLELAEKNAAKSSVESPPFVAEPSSTSVKKASPPMTDNKALPAVMVLDDSTSASDSGMSTKPQPVQRGFSFVPPFTKANSTTSAAPSSKRAKITPPGPKPPQASSSKAKAKAVEAVAAKNAAESPLKSPPFVAEPVSTSAKKPSPATKDQNPLPALMVHNDSVSSPDKGTSKKSQLVQRKLSFVPPFTKRHSTTSEAPASTSNGAGPPPRPRQSSSGSTSARSQPKKEPIVLVISDSE
ncbi:hypothetical protein JCM5296_003266 [Sporobolomyces johnsonii]